MKRTDLSYPTLPAAQFLYILWKLLNPIPVKHFLFLLIILCAQSFSGQTTFLVDNFSKDYFGKVYIADTAEVFSPGWVAVFDKKTNKQLLKINSEELTFTLHEGKVRANVQQLPYGEQSSIIYADFNFDGQEDFALMDGQNSCYHGPSFQIYLADAQGFNHSPEFTELAQDYCGMFSVVAEDQSIFTMTKSGCCWHQYSEFKVKNNIPYPIHIVEESLSANGITWNYSEEKLVNGKMVETQYQMLDTENISEDLVLSFAFENKKVMRIFLYNERLFYVFTDDRDHIELMYDDTFRYSAKNNTLSFTHRQTTYTLSDRKIIARTPARTYTMNAAANSTSGSLAKLKKMDIGNVVKEK